MLRLHLTSSTLGRHSMYIGQLSQMAASLTMNQMQRHRLHTTCSHRLAQMRVPSGASSSLAGQKKPKQYQPILPSVPVPPIVTPTNPTPAPSSSSTTPSSIKSTTPTSSSLPSNGLKNSTPPTPLTESNFFAKPKHDYSGSAPKPISPASKSTPSSLHSSSANSSPSSSSSNSKSSSSSSSSPHPTSSFFSLRRAFRYGCYFVIGSGLVLVGIQYQDDIRRIERADLSPSELWKRTTTFANSLVRLWRDVYCTLWILTDYEWTLRGLEGEEFHEKLKVVNLRSALRLRELMRANGGIYIKLGQHVAQLKFLLPDEYVETMQPMLNQAPTSTVEEIQRVFEEEFGKKITDVFETFDFTPVASASLAQVHFATMKDPSDPTKPPLRVAVKIQHARLERNVESDIATVRFIIRLVHKIDSRFDYNWLGDEMAQNLPLECDFVHEAKNSERAQKNLDCDHRDDVHIPKIYWPYTSRRVLCMERMDGCLVSDVDALRAQNISFEEVSTLIATIFSEMIFFHGFVHCDPHAGNLLVQPRSPTDSRPRIILLDHGLYKELSDEFRISYSHLWNSLIRGDDAGIKKYSQEMNAGDMYALFASMITRKNYDHITAKRGELDALVAKNDESERRGLQAWAVDHAQEVQEILARIPKPLLLLLKTNDCLRAIDTQLGTPINSFLITARFCTRAINQHRMRESHDLRSWLSAWWDTLTMEMRITIYKWMLKWTLWWHRGPIKPASTTA